MPTMAFESTVYQFSWFAVPTFVTATLVFLLGVAVLFRERASAESRFFVLATLTVSVWLYAFSFMYCATQKTTALAWARAAYFGVPFIPSAFYHFSVSVLKLNGKWKRIALASWVVSALFVSSIVGTDLLIKDVYHYWWGFYPQYGSFSIPYLTFFFGMMGLTFFHYWRMTRRVELGTLYQRRAQMFLIAFSIVYIGSVDYLAKFGIGVYPFGYLPVFCFLILAARVIWKYRLVDITASFAANRILETMNEPLIVCDVKGSICIVNQAACTNFGYDADTLVGNSVDLLVGNEALERAHFWAFVTSGYAKEKEWIFRTQNKAPVFVNLSISILKDKEGLKLGYVIIARNVTEYKHVAEELKTLNENLERRVEERTRQLQGKIEELEQLNEVMMGREERVLELKEQLNLLRGQSAEEKPS